MRYNPFSALQSEQDVIALAKSLNDWFQETKEPRKREKGLEFLIAYMWVFVPKEKLNMSTLRMLLDHILGGFTPCMELHKMMQLGERLLQPNEENERKFVYIAALYESLPLLKRKTFVNMRDNLCRLENASPCEMSKFSLEHSLGSERNE